MLVPEVDRIIFHLINDLEERGLLDDTLVVMMGEFGRTPWLNAARGRDHYPDAWSLAMTGAGIKRGVVVGATDSDGVSQATPERWKEMEWWPTKGTTARSDYAGAATCSRCHAGIAASQRKTPMFNAAS